METTVACMICGERHKRITRTHLKKHDMTTDQYKAIFPDAPIVSEELSYKLGEYGRSDDCHNRKEEYRKMVGDNQRGRKRSDITRQRISEARTGVSWGSHTEEHKEYMREVMREDAKRRLAEGIWPPVQTPEGRKRNSERMKQKWANGDFNHLQQVTRTNWENGVFANVWTEELRAKQSANRVRYLKENPTKKTDTGLELNFKAFLEQHGIAYEHQYIVDDTRSGQWLFDFYIPSLNLLVEVDGEYYHTISLRQINRDKRKQNCAWKRGYHFLRISDKDWRPELVFETPDAWKEHSIALVDHRRNDQLIEVRVAAVPSDAELASDLFSW